MIKKVFALSTVFTVFAIGADLNGVWNFTVHTPKDGDGSPVVTIKQNGNTLTGLYLGRVGDLTLNGSVTGDGFTFTVTTAKGDLVFTGKLASDGKNVSGTFTAASFGNGSFTGQKRPPANGAPHPPSQ